MLTQVLWSLRTYIVAVIGAMLALWIAEFFISKMEKIMELDRAEMEHFTGVLKKSGISWMKAGQLTKAQKQAIRLHEKYQSILKDEGKGVSIHT